MVKSKMHNQSYARFNDPIPRLVSSELKYADTNIALSTAISSAGSWTKLTFPAQGVTSITRVADRILGVRIEQTGYFTTTTVDTVRFIILQTRGLFTSAPATTDLLVSASPFAAYTYNSRQLYNIIHDEYFSLSANGDNAIRTHQKTYSLREKDLRFIPGSSNVYDGQVYIFAICINAGCLNGQTFRFWYEDGN
jgi:hypothetical protein